MGNEAIGPGYFIIICIMYLEGRKLFAVRLDTIPILLFYFILWPSANDMTCIVIDLTEKPSANHLR